MEKEIKNSKKNANKKNKNVNIEDVSKKIEKKISEKKVNKKKNIEKELIIKETEKEKNGFFEVILISVIIALIFSLIGYFIGKKTNFENGDYSTATKEIQKFIEEYNYVLENYYGEIDKEELISGAIKGMLSSLDEYSQFVDEDSNNFSITLEGEYEGLGVGISLTTENEIIISTIYPNSPAEKAGLMAGDIIMSVDGTSVVDKSGSEISKLIKNTSKNQVTLVILRNESEMTFTINLEDLLTVDVEYTLLENNIGYLKMNIFSKTLSTQVANALEDLESQGMQKLIVDLRDNTGGYLESAEETANLFLENGKLIYSLENKETKADYYDETSERTTYPIAIILNERSASASEILAAALKDSYSNSVLFVGNKSYGKGLVQQTYDLSDGSMAKYTSAKWLRPNGACIDGIGLAPDYQIDFQYIYDETGIAISDTQIQKAIEIISAL